MPRIFDSIELKLLPSLVGTLKISHKAEFCIGYFNLRGWKQLLPYIEGWNGTEENQSKLLIGMNETSPEEDLKNMLSFSNGESIIYRQQLVKFKHKLTNAFTTFFTDSSLEKPINDLREDWKLELKKMKEAKK